MNPNARIVIIDDNRDYLFAMETFLSKNGFQVVSAVDGKEGMDLIRKEKPDVILLDVMMETLFSGFEVCRQVRRDPTLKAIPIIGISGMADEIDVKFDQEKDREYFSPEIFMEKPIDRDQLLKHIETLLSVA